MQEVSQAPLTGLIGTAGATNVQGEEQAKLDIVADELFLDAMGTSDLVSTMVSEEREEPEYVSDHWGQGHYDVVVYLCECIPMTVIFPEAGTVGFDNP